MTRKEQAEAARKKLLESAKELLFDKGYEKTTIVDITKNCGMSSGNFYHYFDSKDDLILALEREPFDIRYQKSYSNTELSWYERMVEYLLNIIEINCTYFTPRYNGFWFAYHATHPTAIDSPENKYCLLINELSSFLIKGVEAGELSQEIPIKQISEFLVIHYHGAILYSTLTGGEYDLIEEMKKFISEFTESITKYFIKREHQ